MTEQTWLESTTPNLLLAYLRPWTRHRRKFQLYICACSRQNWRLFNAPCQRLIELYEDHAYGADNKSEISATKRLVSREAKRNRRERDRMALLKSDLAYLRSYDWSTCRAGRRCRRRRSGLKEVKSSDWRLRNELPQYQCYR